MFVIYRYPSDFPESYVCRRHVIVDGAHDPVMDRVPLIIAPKVELIRAALERRGLYRLKRDNADDPVILEVWL